MNINEFIDAYSDDLINLHEARTAQLTHPLRGDFAFGNYVDASFCRVLAVFVIGGIETMLEAWRHRDRVNVLDKYFAPNVKNGDKVASLYQAYSDAGIPVDREVFNDYLAIKYLRNTIVHAKWKQHEREWLTARGFPIDTRKLTKEHLDRIEHVNQNMMLYIALTAIADPSAPKPEKLVKLDETVTRRVDESGIIQYRDISRIIWMNLERIDCHINRDIEAVCAAEQFGLNKSDLEGRPWQDVKRLYYLAARRAGEQNHPSLARHRQLASEAIAFWHDYWQRGAPAGSIDDHRIDKALAVLQSPHFRVVGGTPWCPLLDEMPCDEARRLVDSVLKSDAPFTGEQVVDAMRIGHAAYHSLPNIMPVTLFALRLPIVDPENTAAYLREARRALRALKLNREWYSWVECRSPPGDDGLEFYEQMFEEFAGR